MRLRFRAAEHVRAEHHHVARLDGLLPELAEQKRRAVTDDDEIHTVIRHRPDRTMQRPSTSHQRGEGDAIIRFDGIRETVEVDDRARSPRY